MKKAPADWLKEPEFDNIEVMDRDGWADSSWLDKISREEFERRLMHSTIFYNRRSLHPVFR